MTRNDLKKYTKAELLTKLQEARNKIEDLLKENEDYKMSESLAKAQLDKHTRCLEALKNIRVIASTFLEVMYPNVVETIDKFGNEKVKENDSYEAILLRKIKYIAGDAIYGGDEKRGFVR